MPCADSLQQKTTVSAGAGTGISYKLLISESGSKTKSAASRPDHRALRFILKDFIATNALYRKAPNDFSSASACQGFPFSCLAEDQKTRS